MPDRGSVVVIAISAYEIGQLVGLFLLGALGAALILKGLQQWQGKAPVVSAGPPPMMMPTSPVTQPTPTPGAGEDFFFAAPTGVYPASNPAVTDTRWHADYSSGTTATKSPSNAKSIVLLVLGIGLVGAALLQAYLAFLAPRTTIEMPDELLGMERIEADSVLGQQLDAAAAQLTGPGTEDLEIAGYGDIDQFIVVLGGEIDDGSGSPNDYFAGLEEGLASGGQSITLVEAEPGTLGGEMRCAILGDQSVSLCAWVGDGVVGTVVITGPAADDYESTTREIRSNVEH